VVAFLGLFTPGKRKIEIKASELSKYYFVVLKKNNRGAFQLSRTNHGGEGTGGGGDTGSGG